MKHGTLRPQGKVIDHWQLLHESDFEDTDTKLLLHLDNDVIDYATGKTVTNNNVTFSATTWKFNSHSAYFNGTNAYFTVPDSTDWAWGSGDFTVEWWMNTTLPASYYTFYDQYVAANQDVIIDCEKSGSNYFFRFLSYGGSGDFLVDSNSVPALFPENTWVHVALVRTGSTFQWYINGVASGGIVSGTLGTVPDLAAVISIGAWRQSSPQGFFSGYLDEFKIVKGTAKYTAAFTPPTAPYLGRTTTYPITKDRNTVLMISGEGTDGSTTVVDETGKAVTCNGGAQIDTAQFKFGQSSVLFDGSGDYLSLADSTDWAFGNQNWTFDCWARFNALPANAQYLFHQWTTNNNNSMGLYIGNNGAAIRFDHNVAGSPDPASMGFAYAFVINTWYHIALVRNGSTFTIYINGISIGSDTSTVTMADQTSLLYIGANLAGSSYVDGWLDDIRITKGLARWTSNFTPPLKTTALINGDTDEEYRWCVENIFAAASSNTLRLNNDSASNYKFQYLLGEGSSIYAGRSSSSSLTLGYGDAAGKSAQHEGILYAKSGYVRTALTANNSLISGTSITDLFSLGWAWNNTTAPIAAITILNDTGAYMDCGTKVRLYRKVQ